MRSWGLDDAVADAELLVSELVTNAILHARSASRVKVERTGAVVRVAVCDGSSVTPRVRDYGPNAVTDGNGKCVWFEVDARGTGELRAEA